MSTELSVIISTHNPNRIRLERTLTGLKQQTLSTDRWELIIVDNATLDLDYVGSFHRCWHPTATIVREERIGLTRARLTGISVCQGKYIVFVDDDNVLQPNYLCQVIKIFKQHSNIGAIGGKSIPEFEAEPAFWIHQFHVCLALRDFGDEIKTYSCAEDADKQYPDFAPIGAGMSLRKEAADYYRNVVESDTNRLSFDRTGKSLQSGGDCDINLTLLGAGWTVGYFPELSLTHLISARRLTKAYVAKLNYASSRSWVRVLDVHGIHPWRCVSKWSLLPRKVKAFFTYQPWRSAEAFIRWRGACGLFEGLAAL